MRCSALLAAECVKVDATGGLDSSSAAVGLPSTVGGVSLHVTMDQSSSVLPSHRLLKT
jgi:hypothetical protein